MDNSPISIYVFPLTDNCFEMVKKEIMAKDQEIDQLTSHPRYVRYLGTCFNAVKKEAYVITDFVAGATIQVSYAENCNIKNTFLVNKIALIYRKSGSCRTFDKLWSFPRKKRFKQPWISQMQCIFCMDIQRLVFVTIFYKHSDSY